MAGTEVVGVSVFLTTYGIVRDTFATTSLITFCHYNTEKKVKLTRLKSVLVEDREMCDYCLILIFKKYLKEYQAFHSYFEYFYYIKGHNLIADLLDKVRFGKQN